MRTLLRLAWRLALSRDGRQRWRQLSVITSCFVGALCLLVSLSVAVAAQDAERRVAARTPIFATSTADTALYLSERGILLGDREVSLLWIEPAPGHEDDPGVVPPGLDELPAPGEAVLSTGLLEAGVTAESLGAAPSTSGAGGTGAIGASGLGTDDELLAYLRPAEGRGLGEGGALMSVSHFAGAGSEGSRALERGAAPSSPTIRAKDARALVLLLLVVPGLAVLAMGVRAQSTVRRARSEVLIRLGVRTRVVRLLMAVEAGILASIGALAAAAVHRVVVGRATAVPLTVTVFPPGALALAWRSTLLVLVLVVALAATASSAGRLIASTRQRPVRPAHPRRLLGVAAGLAVVVLCQPIAGLLSYDPSYPFMLGVFVLVVTLPYSTPALSGIIARRAARAGSDHLWLASARVSHDSRRSSRIAALLMMIVFLGATSVSMYRGSLGVGDDPSSTVPQGLAVYDVNWRGGVPDDLSRLRTSLAGLGEVSALPVVGTWDESDPTTSVGVEACSQIEAFARAVGVDVCNDGSFDRAGLDALGTMLGVRFVPQPDADAGSVPTDVLVLAARALDPLTLYRAGGFLPAFNPSDLLRTAPVVQALSGWIEFGWTLSLVVLVLGILRELVEHILQVITDDERFVRIGVDLRDADRVSLWTVVLPIVATVPLAYACGLATAAAGVGTDLTLYAPGFITSYTIGVLVLTAGAVATAFALKRSWPAEAR